MLRYVLRFMRRRRQLNRRMKEFERNGMHATWAEWMPRSRWM